MAEPDEGQLTDRQRQVLALLRDPAQGYTSVAKALGVTKTTVLEIALRLAHRGFRGVRRGRGGPGRHTIPDA